MQKKGSWYFDGYKGVEVPKENGKGTRRELVYVGEYYGFEKAGQQKRMKRLCLILSILCIAAYFYAQLTPYVAGMVHWMAIPSLISLVPMMFAVIGLVNFLPAKEKWEIRVFYAGYRRLFRSSVILLALLAIWVVMEIALIILNPSIFLGELHYLLAAIVSTAVDGVMVYEIRKNPAYVVQGPTIE